MGVVKATLKQKPIKGLVHKQLPCRLAVIERFRIIRIRGSQDDKSHVVALKSVTPRESQIALKILLRFLRGA